MKNTTELYRVESLPVFQNLMFRTADEAMSCPTGDVVLVQDHRTGLIYNAAFDPELVTYGVDYQNEQACSPAFRDHLDNVAVIIEKHFNGKSLLEVGCGKGFFLEFLQSKGFSIKGVDPSYEGRNDDVVRQFFKPELELRADGIILRHVLEHVMDPVGFLREISETNRGGRIYIEVPCFEWICRQRSWFDIFYEHVNYFRLIDFERIFGSIMDSGHLFGGQYLFVVADLSTVRSPSNTSGEALSFPRDFTSEISMIASRILECRRGSDETRRAAVWGGASKGLIFSLFLKRAGAPVDFVIDINPAKQGKYLATVGLKVIGPQQALRVLGISSDIYVMNELYLPEIQAISNNQYNYIVV